MKDRIVIIDTFSYGSFHEMFNAEMLEAYSRIFKKCILLRSAFKHKLYS